MKRNLIFLAALAACGLMANTAPSGCNFAVPGTVQSQEQLDELRSGYDASVLTLAAHYRQLGYCASGTTATLTHPCADRRVVAKLRAIDKSVRGEFDQIQALINSGNLDGIPGIVTQIEGEIATATSVMAALNTSGGSK
jgi:hypothetical protein